MKRLFRVVRYRFDNFISLGGLSIFASQVVIFVALLSLISVGRYLSHSILGPVASPHGPGFFENLYITFLQMTDPGNMSQDIETIPELKVFSVFAGISGLLMFSALVAFTTSAVNQKINQLKKGRSVVIESGHTLILGWNPRRIVEVIHELIIANSSERDASVVILADVDKSEMDDVLQQAKFFKSSTRIITRRGKPFIARDLDLVSINTCKSVIAIASCSSNAANNELAVSDSEVIKAVLAACTFRDSRAQFSLVAEIWLARNRQVLDGIATDGINYLDSSDILAKLLVQTSRSLGLSAVYSELLSFRGCEIYPTVGDWDGECFSEMVCHFQDGVPIGVVDDFGMVTLNPAPSYRMLKTDQLLVVANDDSSILYHGTATKLPLAEPLLADMVTQSPEAELLIGWSAKSEIIVLQYDSYVMPGSSIDILVDEQSGEMMERVSDLNKKLENVNVKILLGDRLDRESLIEINPLKYNNIIILNQNCSGPNESEPDAQTIITLLLLRQIFEDSTEAKLVQTPKVVTEVAETENQMLVTSVGVNDFIISDQLVSMILAQISENPVIKLVYDQLFEEAGAELYIKPIKIYTEEVDANITFLSLSALACARGETCIGFKRSAFETDAANNFGVCLNPQKEIPLNLSLEDALVVLAEDER